MNAASILASQAQQTLHHSTWVLPAREATHLHSVGTPRSRRAWTNMTAHQLVLALQETPDVLLAIDEDCGLS